MCILCCIYRESIICSYAKVIVFFHSANINRNNIATFAIVKIRQGKVK